MCTTQKCFISGALCFTETDDEGTNMKGVCSRVCNFNVCTKNKATAADDVGSYQVYIKNKIKINHRTTMLPNIFLK